MEEIVEKVRAYLADLEADRRAALTLSEQKAEEAKLIQARQEGVQAALRLFSSETLVRNAAVEPQEPRRRRGRRPIRELILRELSFSGQPTTADQIAKAIDYIPERTEMALGRLEKDGQVLRSGGARWVIALPGVAQINGHELGANDGKFRAPT